MIKSMTEVMHPTVNTSEGGIFKPPLLEPASIPRVPFQEYKPTPPEYQLPLQLQIKDRLIHLFGNEYTPAIALRALRERGRALSDAVAAVPDEALNSGTLDLETLSEIGDRSSCIRITAGILATKYGINLQNHIDRKLMTKMQVKYPPDYVTEVRLYGTEEDPGKKSGLEAIALLKSSYDEATGTQHYRFRGMAVPRYEEDARTPNRTFSGTFQDLANWWQTRSLGSDLIPTERMVNLLGEDGEIEEVLGIFEGMTKDQINGLSRERVDDLRTLESTGYELADVFIGTYCADAALGIDSNKKDKERMDIAVKKYGKLPRYRTAGYSLLRIIDRLDETYKRKVKGLTPPPPLALAANRSGS